VLASRLGNVLGVVRGREVHVTWLHVRGGSAFMIAATPVEGGDP